MQQKEANALKDKKVAEPEWSGDLRGQGEIWEIWWSFGWMSLLSRNLGSKGDRNDQWVLFNPNISHL